MILKRSLSAFKISPTSTSLRLCGNAMHDLRSKIAAAALSVGGVFAAHSCSKGEESPLVRETLPAHHNPLNRSEWNFDSCLTFVLEREGGRATNRHDRGNKNGGITQNGVTQETYDIYRTAHGLKTQSVERITPAEIRGVYKELFWDGVKCDKIPDPEMKLILFDAAVNHGTGGAVRLLQRAIGGLKTDGDLGPNTEAALERVADYELLKSRFIEERLALYQRIAERDPAQGRFLNGWRNRISDICEAIADSPPAAEIGTTEPTLAKVPIASYTVKENDSLWSIAQRELGNPNRWSEIAALNGLDPKRPTIASGQTILLPHR